MRSVNLDKTAMKKKLLVIPDMKGEFCVFKNNLRILAGKPLIAYAIEAAQRCTTQPLDIVVTTNDASVIHLCDTYSIPAIPNQFIDTGNDPDVTLDPIINDTVRKVERERNHKYDIIITLQPTSPLIKAETIDAALNIFEHSDYDTILSAINEPRLAWKRTSNGFLPQYAERKNRNNLPEYLVETGTFLICDRTNLMSGSRIGEKVYIYQLPKNEGLEIINEYDWLIAEKELSKKTILIRLDGYVTIGMGHIYRGLQLANMLFEHKIIFVISHKSELAEKKIKDLGYTYIVINDNIEILEIIKNTQADIVINDILNTDAAYMKQLSASHVRVVNLEDLGDGAVYADAVINDLYEPQNELSNFYWGSRFYCLREEYFNAKRNPKTNTFIREILVSLGGTDPSHLTEKVVEACLGLPTTASCNITLILGAGNSSYEKIMDLIKSAPKHISFNVLQDVSSLSFFMEKADLAISSQGRTMYELAYMTVPTIIMAQNPRELTHEFGYLSNGFINLGLGTDIDVHTICETIVWLMNCPQIRQQMKKRMASMDLEKGIYRVKKIILGE